MGNVTWGGDCLDPITETVYVNGFVGDACCFELRTHSTKKGTFLKPLIPWSSEDFVEDVDGEFYCPTRTGAENLAEEMFLTFFKDLNPS